MGAGIESVSSSMGFLPMNSEAFAGNFASACAEPGEPHRRAQATVAESPYYVGNLGKYVQVSSLSAPVNAARYTALLTFVEALH